MSATAAPNTTDARQHSRKSTVDTPATSDSVDPNIEVNAVSSTVGSFRVEREGFSNGQAPQQRVGVCDGARKRRGRRPRNAAANRSAFCSAAAWDARAVANDGAPR